MQSIIGTNSGYTTSEQLRDFWRNNQWLGLLESLITLRAWRHVDILASWLRERGVTDPAVHPPIWRALCTALHDLTSVVYPSVSLAYKAATEYAAEGFASALATLSASQPAPRKQSAFVDVEDSIEPPVSPAEVPSALRPLLSLLGVHIANDVKLYVKMCRIIQSVLASGAGAPAAATVVADDVDVDTDTGAASASTGGLSEDGLSELSPAQLDAYTVLRDFLLPALSFFGPNVGIVSGVWDCVKLLSWKLRYAMYANWR